MDQISYSIPSMLPITQGTAVVDGQLKDIKIDDYKVCRWCCDNNSWVHTVT